MNEMLFSLSRFTPELIIIVGIVVLFLLDAFIPSTRQNRTSLVLVVLVCILGGLATGINWNLPPSLFFSSLVAHDSFSNFFRLFFFFATGLSAYIAFGSKELEKESRLEFSLLLLIVTFGLSSMALSTHLLTLYIGIETVSIVSFVMAGFSREDVKSNEASFKYFVFGALASGLMLYGLSLIYGLTGSLQYVEIAKSLSQHSGPTPLILALALVLIYAGFAYKIASFPMHFWTPDVYEGAPTPVATFFSVGPKAAGFAALIRFVIDVLTQSTQEDQWKALADLELVNGIAFASVATMFVGNLCALGQTNVKRILAYSSIAHVGYMLMGLVSMDTFGLQAILFYLIAYCLMNVGAFWVTSIVSDLRGNSELESFTGMGWQMPILGTCMGVFLFSLTGIPLFSGFIGKFLLFSAVVKTPGLLWLAVFGVLNSVISLYYYAKIIKAMWLERGEERFEMSLAPYHGVGLVALAIPTVAFGLFFAPILHFTLAALRALL